MKHWICMLALLTACGPGAAPAQAQFRSFFNRDDQALPRTFSGGFVAGANFCQVDGDLRSGYHRVGLNAGGVVYARFGSSIGASMELLFAQKGSVSRNIIDAGIGTTAESYDIRLNYVEVPVMLHYFSPGRLHYGAGLSYARLLSTREEAFINAPVNLHPEVNYFRKQDLSGMAEVAFEFYRGNFISLRYSYSLMSIRDAERIPQYYGGGLSPGQYNNVFSLRWLCLIR